MEWGKKIPLGRLGRQPNADKRRPFYLDTPDINYLIIFSFEFLIFGAGINIKKFMRADALTPHDGRAVYQWLSVLEAASF